MVADRLALVRERIESAAKTAAREASDVTLIAVSKSRTVDEIGAAYDSGQRDFGENRVDELARKAPLLPTDINWHFVGSLQSRKAPVAAQWTYLLHSMDRLSLARRWASTKPEVPCLLQVNIGAETQKHGVAPASLDETLDDLAEVGVRPIGLMAIPPAPDAPEAARPYFAELAALARRARETHTGLTELSMGMTDDFEVAVQEGATMVRVGRAIFGTRTD